MDNKKHTEDYEAVLELMIERDIKPLELTAMVAHILKWDIMIEDGKPEDDVRGISIGTMAYLEDLTHDNFSGPEEEDGPWAEGWEDRCGKETEQ